MKVFTNEDNPQALKILVSAAVSGCGDLSWEFVKTSDKRFQSPRRLPVLQLKCGSLLFSSNAACFYLFPPSASIEKQVDQWLSWDSVKLQPLMALIGTKTDPSSKIRTLLDELEKALENKLHLVQGEFSVADICLSSSLYPLFVVDKYKSQYFSDKQFVSNWLVSLFSRSEFKDAENKLQLKKDSSLQSFIDSCWFPTASSDPSHAASAKSEASHEEVQDKVLTEEEIVAAVAAWEKGVSSRLRLKPPQKPVLPQKGKNNILITSALPYVNNVPHLGNIIGCVLSADVFARYCRSRGYNTLFVCGTDEYGTATENKALEEGLTPQQICDKYFAIHRDIYQWFSIEFDHFGRTTTPAQTEIVQQLFMEVHNGGYTLIDSVDQLLCEKCDRYLADRFVEGICPNCKYEDARGDQCDGCGHLINAVELVEPRCKQCRTTPVVKQSKQIFLDLPKIQKKVELWFGQSSDEWSAIAKVITRAWLKEGLKPRCITRDLKWGVPVPLDGFENKVFYVWFDAPIGYMSITKGYTKEWLQWWKPGADCKVTLYQFMAKDNVPFHSIMFPSTLIACDKGYTMLSRLFATEYLNYENGKFSKSRGIGVFGNDAKDTGIPSDIFRFYLLYLRPESQDSNFSWADLAMKNNTELLNNLGNFILRSLSFCEKFFEGRIPRIVMEPEEKELIGRVSVELKSFVQALDKGRLRDGVKYILNISRHGNQYMQNTKPWVLVKGTDKEKEKAATAIGLLCNVVCLVASLLQPYMPQTVETIAKQMNLDISSLSIMDTFQPFLEEGHAIGKPLPLFTKIDSTVVEMLKEKYAGRQKSSSPEVQAGGKLNLDGIDQLTALASLEKAVATQAELVRSMKAAGKSKDDVKPHVTALLDLKKQLADFKAVNSSPPTAPLPNGVAESALADLEAQIAVQADKVRSMKAAGKSKDEVKPEVDKLLDLKSKLPAASSGDNNSNPPKSENSSKSKKKNKKK
ncbi:synthetase [Nesidiocoris tenuis]|uniref:Methionine--tRNA ligase, cytoplasmic n=1 Tax=Nesidiocoris tenuis TaxID=355587 RepID=A0ABN7AQ57_9HEMI|nr:synthetase [Nesidiocoris tenuis]